MRLIAFSLEGYRRFVEKTSVKLHGDLVTFVGPNEAGKSSLLRALAHLHKAGGFVPNERPRRTSLEPKLTWHFQLDASDRDALASIPDAGHVERAAVTKKADGKRTWEFEPRRPRRDRSDRAAAVQVLRTHRASAVLDAADGDESSEFFLEDFDHAVETLEADVENYDTSDLDALREMARCIRSVEIAEVEADTDEDPQEGESALVRARQREEWGSGREVMVQALDELVAKEATPSPWRMTFDALKDRLPRIILFSDEDRELSSEYDLTEVGDSPPAALGHLASLADLDLIALRDEAASQAVPDVATRRNAANKKLLTAFDQSWNQQGIAVQIEVQGTVLHIQATTPEDAGLSDIAERSDGMRWFAALLAYAYGWDDQPILLVDEIERHLHYDAQSDLVEVLAKQEFTSKVIYTTHSFGCLPHDLGTGVRVVQPLDAATSRLENGFWKRGSGFSPLLASMGAAALSFTPARHALIAEGASDAILLPSLLRQAANERRLGFQIAPGLSSVAAAAVRDLEAEAGRVGFIVDGDKGGTDIIEKLVSSGVRRDRVVVLTDEASGQALEVEDFVDRAVYARAVNEELHCWQTVSVDVTIADLGESMRTTQLRAWCGLHGLRIPDKAAVAQRVVEASSEQQVVEESREDLLRSLLSTIHSILGLR